MEIVLEELVADQDQQLVEQVVSVTNKLLLAASRSDWDLVATLDHQRREVLEQCIGIMEDRQLEAVFRAVLESNKELMAHVVRTRDLISGSLQQISRGKLAELTYSERR